MEFIFFVQHRLQHLLLRKGKNDVLDNIPFSCCLVVTRNMSKSLLNYLHAYMYTCLHPHCLWASAGTFGEYQGLPPCLRGSADPDCRSVSVFSGEPVLWLWSGLAHLCIYSVTALTIKPSEPCCLSTIDSWLAVRSQEIYSVTGI